MSKPPKTNFKDLISGALAAPAPEPEAPMAVEMPPAPQPQAPREVTVLKPRRALAQKSVPVGQGTLKERAHQLSLYLEEPVYDALREIAHVERTKLHALILEGIDLVLKKRGSPSIKELIKSTG